MSTMSALKEEAARPYSRLAAIYDEVMAGVPYEEWLDFVVALCLLHGKRPLSALDVACGTGNFSFLLEEQGLRVVGVDRSPEMLKVARRKARQRGSRIRLMEGGLPGLPQLGRFDLVTCIYDSINHLGSREELVAGLASIRDALAPGGVVVFDANTTTGLIKVWGNRTEVHRAGNIVTTWHFRCDAEGRRASLRIAFPDGAVETHVERGYTPEELGDAATEAGLRLLGVYDDRVLGPAGPDSVRAWVVAERVGGVREKA